MSEQQAEKKATHKVTLTDAATEKVKSLLDQEGRDDLRLRIAVQPGGCSGRSSRVCPRSRSSGR